MNKQFEFFLKLDLQKEMKDIRTDGTPFMDVTKIKTYKCDFCDRHVDEEHIIHMLDKQVCHLCDQRSYD